MAKRRIARSRRQGQTQNGTARGAAIGATVEGLAESSLVVPRVLLGAVNGLETVAVGALQLARNVLVSAVSGAADVGTEALSATMAGTRGVVVAASRMVGDIALTAQSTVRETVRTASQTRLPPGDHIAPRRPLARIAPDEPSLLERAVTRQRVRRAPRAPRPGVAA
jgi:hypothetical protein